MSKPRYINPDSREARINKRRQKILSDRGYNVAINGSWGPWQQKIWNLTIAQDPTITKRVNISKITQKENRGRAVPVEALEQFQDSLIGRSYPYPQRLAILATSLQEVDHRGAASVGKGGNGLLGLSKERSRVVVNFWTCSKSYFVQISCKNRFVEYSTSNIIVWQAIAKP